MLNIKPDSASGCQKRTRHKSVAGRVEAPDGKDLVEHEDSKDRVQGDLRQVLVERPRDKPGKYGPNIHEKAKKRVLERGSEILAIVWDKPIFKVCNIVDPDGNPIQVREHTSQLNGQKNAASLKDATYRVITANRLFWWYDNYLVFPNNEAGQVCAHGHWATVSRL